MGPAPAAVTPAPLTRWALWSLVACAVEVVAVLVTLVHAAGGPTQLFTGGGALSGLAFVLWNLGPALGMAGVVLLVGARWRRAWPAALAGVVLLLLVTGVALAVFLLSESSTAALIFVSLPVLPWGLVLLTLVAAFLLRALLDARARRAEAGAR